MTNSVRYAVGPHTSYSNAGKADIAAPIYKVRAQAMNSTSGESFDRVTVRALQKSGDDGKTIMNQQDTYTLNPTDLINVSKRELHTM